jgi:hypothetical protein
LEIPTVECTKTLASQTLVWNLGLQTRVENLRFSFTHENNHFNKIDPMVVSLQILKVQRFLYNPVWSFFASCLFLYSCQFFKLFYSSEAKAKGGWTEEKYFTFAFLLL